MHAAEITVNRGWPHFAENLVHQVGEHTAPAAFSSSIFSRPSFCKFFGKAANILPQIKHERPPSSCVAAVHRLWEETGVTVLALVFVCLCLCLSVFNVLVLVLCVFNVVLSVRGCSKTRRGLEAFGGKVRSEKMRQVAFGWPHVLALLVLLGSTSWQSKHCGRNSAWGNCALVTLSTHIRHNYEHATNTETQDVQTHNPQTQGPHKVASAHCR